MGCRVQGVGCRVRCVECRVEGAGLAIRDSKGYRPKQNVLLRIRSPRANTRNETSS